MKDRKLEGIDIINFQGHENTTFDFHEGVNALWGKSGNGKSTVLKALEWVENDSIAGVSKYGNAPHSHWIKGKTKSGKDKIVGNTEVSIRFTDKHIIKRVKGKDSYYEITYPDGEVLKLTATGSGSPQQVKEIFDFKEPNFAKQHEGIYLLFDSPGQIAKQLNEIADLTLPTKVLAQIKSEIRSNNSTKDVLEEDISNIIEELKGYEGIEKLEKSLSALEDKEEEVYHLKRELEKIISLQERYESLNNELNSLKGLDKKKELLYDIQSKQQEISTLSDKIISYQSILDDGIYLKQELAKLKNVSEREKSLKEIKAQYDKISAIKTTLNQYLMYKDSATSFHNQLKTLKGQKELKMLTDLAEKRHSIDEQRKTILTMENYLEAVKRLYKESKEIGIRIEENKKDLKGVNCPTCNKPLD